MLTPLRSPFVPNLRRRAMTLRSFHPAYLFVLLLTGTLMSENAIAQERATPLEPPVARKVPRAETLHGDRRVDDYYWLREKSDAAVIDYLKAENAYTDGMTKGTESFQEALYKEM